MKVSLDDDRLRRFTNLFPETTTAAMLMIRDMLETAERVGRETAVDGLGEELERRVEKATRERTELLCEQARRFDSVVREASSFAHSWMRLEDAQNKARAK